ncbi:MAG TPA: hypothetical protein VM285_03970 [Polyangia bacterium]|nr:hypothetical protein [Polyangia bacterium]
MPQGDNDDKSKRSWRDVDRNKDRSKHRQEDRPPIRDANRQARADSASKVYRSKLDTFFHGEGAAPAQVKGKLAALDESSAEGRERTMALGEIKAASTSIATAKATRRYLERWKLPPDHEVLVQVIGSGEEEHQRLALEQIADLLGRGRVPRRTAVLEQRLRRIVDLGEEPAITALAEAVLQKLRG